MKTKRETLNEIENGRYVLNARGQRLEVYSFRDALELAYNAGYSAGRKSMNAAIYGPRQPLYGIDGQQIREVTQAEIDWTP